MPAGQRLGDGDDNPMPVWLMARLHEDPTHSCESVLGVGRAVPGCGQSHRKQWSSAPRHPQPASFCPNGFSGLEVLCIPRTLLTINMTRERQ